MHVKGIKDSLNIYVYFFPVLEMEPRALHMLGKCSNAQLSYLHPVPQLF
jgi:hypothetical protein